MSEPTADDLLDLEKATMDTLQIPCAYGGVERLAFPDSHVAVRLQGTQDIRFCNLSVGE